MRCRRRLRLVTVARVVPHSVSHSTAVPTAHDPPKVPDVGLAGFVGLIGVTFPCDPEGIGNREL